MCITICKRRAQSAHKYYVMVIRSVSGRRGVDFGSAQTSRRRRDGFLMWWIRQTGIMRQVVYLRMVQRIMVQYFNRFEIFNGIPTLLGSVVYTYIDYFLKTRNRQTVRFHSLTWHLVSRARALFGGPGAWDSGNGKRWSLFIPSRTRSRHYHSIAGINQKRSNVILHGTSSEEEGVQGIPGCANILQNVFFGLATINNARTDTYNLFFYTINVSYFFGI